jgi:tRNA (cytidine/uridine-2'-O-)-methyltransferase
MRIALYEPDIPQNAGAILRTASCVGIEVDLIEPLGFIWSDRRLRRAGLDYLDGASVARHRSWPAFRAQLRPPARLVLMTTGGECSHIDFGFRPDDVLLFGRESRGVPDDVHAAADARVRIPLRAGCRSLNVAVACAIVLSEALRQLDDWPA